MDINKPLETVYIGELRHLAACPDQPRVYTNGAWAAIKNELLRNNLITYEGKFKYALTDLGREKLAERPLRD